MALQEPSSGPFSNLTIEMKLNLLAWANLVNFALGYNAYVLVLAIDTCDSRGSVALLEKGAVLALAEHEANADYSSWLLPSVAAVLKRTGYAMPEVAGYAAAAGPGSFTGVRVGLTTVKAWAEVHRKPVAAVSRLEAIAEQAPAGARRVAAFVDARRGQVFGAVYKRDRGGVLSKLGDEMVIAPGKFVEEAQRLGGEEGICWLSPDASLMLDEAAWKARQAKGERIEAIAATLAPMIGHIGARHLREGQAVDALALDANYVRRSDAEIFSEGRERRAWTLKPKTSA